MERYLLAQWQPQQRKPTGKIIHKKQNTKKNNADLAKTQDTSLKDVANAFVRGRNKKVRNKLLKNKRKVCTQLVQAAKKITTQQICDGITQTRLIDPKGRKLKIINIQRTTVANLERLHKMPAHPSSRFF